jgi:hypothetical protein
MGPAKVMGPANVMESMAEVGFMVEMLLLSVVEMVLLPVVEMVLLSAVEMLLLPVVEMLLLPQVEIIMLLLPVVEMVIEQNHDVSRTKIVHALHGLNGGMLGENILSGPIEILVDVSYNY